MRDVIGDVADVEHVVNGAVPGDVVIGQFVRFVSESVVVGNRRYEHLCFVCKTLL